MKSISRRKFIKCASIVFAGMAMGTFVGCSSDIVIEKDINGLCINKAYIGGISTTIKKEPCATAEMWLKNISDHDIIITKRSFYGEIGNNYLKHGYSDYLLLCTDRTENSVEYLAVRQVTIAPGEEKIIRAEFILNEAQVIELTLNGVMTVTLYNDNKKQSVFRNNKKVSFGPVESV